MLTVPADRHSCGHERSWIRWYEVLVSHGSWHQPKVGDVEQLHLVLVERAVVDHRRDDKLDIYLYIYIQEIRRTTGNRWGNECHMNQVT